jgi:hypothetical protein
MDRYGSSHARCTPARIGTTGDRTQEVPDERPESRLAAKGRLTLPSSSQPRSRRALAAVGPKMLAPGIHASSAEPRSGCGPSADAPPPWSLAPIARHTHPCDYPDAARWPQLPRNHTPRGLAEARRRTSFRNAGIPLPQVRRRADPIAPSVCGHWGHVRTIGMYSWGSLGQPHYYNIIRVAATATTYMWGLRNQLSYGAPHIYYSLSTLARHYIVLFLGQFGAVYLCLGQSTPRFRSPQVRSFSP